MYEEEEEEDEEQAEGRVTQAVDFYPEVQGARPESTVNHIMYDVIILDMCEADQLTGSNTVSSCVEWLLHCSDC